MALGERLELTLSGVEAPLEVTYNAVDMRRWESEHGRSVLAEQRSISLLTWLGWSAARRAGATELDYPSFDEQCVDVRRTRDPDEVTPGPTPPAATGEQSVSSP